MVPRIRLTTHPNILLNTVINIIAHEIVVSSTCWHNLDAHFSHEISCIFADYHKNVSEL